MLGLFGDWKAVLKVDHSKIQIDGHLFRILCGFTAVILLAFSVLLTASLYVGNPIDCMQDFSADKDIINSFCWIHSTFTMPKIHPGLINEDALPYLGIQNSASDPNNKRKYYHYYRWVSLALFCQAILCYLPRWIWKMLEGGAIRELIIDIKAENSVLDEDRPRKLLLLADHLFEHTGYRKMWTMGYFLCEFLALANVIGQLYLMDMFFEGEFRNYGLQVINLTCKDQMERNDIMISIFPRLTKCEFQSFGISASIEKFDALCILPLNVINEKIYLFIWFWFLAMALLLALLMLIRMAMICSHNFRRFSLGMNARSVPSRQMAILVRELSLGDWYFLKALGRNLDSSNFSDILKCLLDKITRPSAVLTLDYPATASSSQQG